jgi:hypothetical protein
VLFDGLDITDPAGEAPLLYPDVQFFEELSLVTSANPPESAGHGAKLQLVTRAGALSLSEALRLRYTGAALQSENLSVDIVTLGVEPREMLRFGSAGFELRAPRFYTARNGFFLSTRIPRFEAEEKFYLRSFTGKLTGERTSFLGSLQHLGRPTLGARPIDLDLSTSSGETSWHLEDVPFDPARGEVLVVCHRHFADLVPLSDIVFRVEIVSGDGHEEVTRYTVHHQLA